VERKRLRLVTSKSVCGWASLLLLLLDERNDVVPRSEALLGGARHDGHRTRLHGVDASVGML